MKKKKRTFSDRFNIENASKYSQPSRHKADKPKQPESSKILREKGLKRPKETDFFSKHVVLEFRIIDGPKDKTVAQRKIINYEIIKQAYTRDFIKHDIRAVTENVFELWLELYREEQDDRTN